MKIALGSAQFGLDYGVSNNMGQVSQREVDKILATALQKGIVTIDTASGYGNSEKVLGHSELSKQLDFITKVSPKTSPQHYHSEILSSQRKLKTGQLKAILIHHGELLLGKNGDQIYSYLFDLKNKYNLTNQIGCSLFSTEDAIAISNRYDIDIVQLPGNIFDQRILNPEALNRLKSKDIEIHVRSLFLQGALFFESKDCPEFLSGLKEKLLILDHMSDSLSDKRIAIAMAPFIQNSSIDKIVLGCCSAFQLNQLVQSYCDASNLHVNISQFATNDEDIINPSLWNR